MRTLTTTFCLLAALSIPTATLAQQESLSWEFYPGTDAATGLSDAAAILAVPGTDDQALTLFCRYAPGADMQVEVSFNMAVSAFRSDVPVTLHWQTAASSGVEQGASFIGGISDGITLRTGLNSRLMGELATAGQITYFDINVSGLPPVTAPLSGNRAALQAFTDYCGQIQQTQGRPEAPVAPGPAAALEPDFGPNISGHVWTRYTDVRENVFDTVLEVAYGVPETDDTLILGQCVIGAQGPLVAMQIAADIEGQAENAVATLRVRNGAGQEVNIEGSVVGTQAEFGVSGIELVLEPSDPAWQVIAGDATVNFERVGSRGGFTLTGNGPNTLAPYLTDCQQIDTLAAGNAPSPAAPIGAQDGFLSCDSFGRVGSSSTGQPISLTFLNESGAFRHLDWIDGNGTPVQQGSLNPGEQISFNTDPGHIWMATDGPGNCQEMIQPVPGQAIYRLLAQ